MGKIDWQLTRILLSLCHQEKNQVLITKRLRSVTQIEKKHKPLSHFQTYASF